MKKIVYGILGLIVFLHLAVNTPGDWINRIHIRGLSRHFKHVEFNNEEILIAERRSDGDCFEEKSIKDAFGNVCYTKERIIIDGVEFELVKKNINLWYPRVKVFNDRLYVMFYSGDSQTINLKVFVKSKGRVVLISHYKVDHRLTDEDEYTIMDIDFYILEKTVLISTECKRSIYFGLWDLNVLDTKLKLVAVFDETNWVEEKPILIGNSSNIFLFFETGSYIGGGTSGGLTLVAKYSKVTNRFKRPRVFEWAHLKTRDSSPVNMIKVDNNENIFYKAMENDKYYKTNYNDLSQIQTTDEIFRDIFSF